MQRVTHCILVNACQQVLLLQKPERKWWVAPGGKMEPAETIIESVKREYKEETGLLLVRPELRGVFTIVIEENNEMIDEWMLFTFLAREYTGDMLSQSKEGHLQWHNMKDIPTLHKPKGDQVYFDHILYQEDMLFLTFRYTKDYELIDFQ